MALFHSCWELAFKQEPFHPVETNLEMASIASEDNDADAFKQARSAVLEYLEPQYQRIVAQAAAMAEFVKAENRHKEERGWPSLFQGFDYPPQKDLLTTCFPPLDRHPLTVSKTVVAQVTVGSNPTPSAGRGKTSRPPATSPGVSLTIGVSE